MRTSRKLAHLLLALFALVVMSSFALAADPGLLYPPVSEASDQKAGSILFYNSYTSGATSGNAQNARINITNTSNSSAAFVHLYFVAEGCSIADSFICLTATQTASFLASDVDPGISGYIVAVAVDGRWGCPVAFNWLIGDEYVKFATGHAANLGAVAFSALWHGIGSSVDVQGNPVGAPVLPGCDGNTVVTSLIFTGTNGAGTYNRAPATLALSNVGSRADGNDTLLIINRVGGNLGIGAFSVGTLFGLLYDDAENVLSFSINGTCQLRTSLTNNSPRTTPRFETFIPAGRTGWLKVYAGGSQFNQGGSIGILGAAINFNANAASSAGAFNGGHNLHHLTLNSGNFTSSGTFINDYVVPVFPPSC